LVDATYTAAAKQALSAFSGSGIGRYITGRFVFGILNGIMMLREFMRAAHGARSMQTIAEVWKALEESSTYAIVEHRVQNLCK
jgi:hypothetical protein